MALFDCVVPRLLATLACRRPQAQGAAPISVTCNGGGCSPDWYQVGVTVAFVMGHDRCHRASQRLADANAVIKLGHDRRGLAIVTIDYSSAVTCGSRSNDQERRYAANSHGRLSESRSRFERLVQPSGWNQLQRVGCDIGARRLQLHHLRRPGQCGCFVLRNVHRQCGKRERTGELRPDSSTTRRRRPSRSRLSRGPDSGGWYNHPVDFQANGSDNLSGIASCKSGTIGGGGSVSASCTRQMRATSAAPACRVNYDSSAPSIDSITFDRPPDSNGWYNHPVRVTFHGSDGGSGIGACSDIDVRGPGHDQYYRQRDLHGQGGQPSRRHVAGIQVRRHAAHDQQRRVRLG